MEDSIKYINIDDLIPGEFQAHFESIGDDTDSLANEVKHYETKIYNRLLDNLGELNDAYSWCMLYNKCMEDDINYRKKLGEDNGKVYDKYGEFKSETS